MSQKTDGRMDLPADGRFEAVAPEVGIAHDPQAGTVVEGAAEAETLQVAVVSRDRLDLQEVGHRSSASLYVRHAGSRLVGPRQP